MAYQLQFWTNVWFWQKNYTLCKKLRIIQCYDGNPKMFRWIPLTLHQCDAMIIWNPWNFDSFIKLRTYYYQYVWFWQQKYAVCMKIKISLRNDGNCKMFRWIPLKQSISHRIQILILMQSSLLTKLLTNFLFFFHFPTLCKNVKIFIHTVYKKSNFLNT